jgi:hypothetical protein
LGGLGGFIGNGGNGGNSGHFPLIGGLIPTGLPGLGGFHRFIFGENGRNGLF